MIMDENETPPSEAENISIEDASSDTIAEKEVNILDANPVAEPSQIKRLLDIAINHHAKGENTKAEIAYRNVLRANPKTAAAWINLGILNRTIGKFNPAVICLRRGLALDPKNANGWSSLGNGLRALNRLEEAKRAQEHGLSLSPEISQIHYNYALVLRDLGMLDAAIKSFIRSEALGYTKAELLWDRSLTYLTAGNYKRGFLEYESRWKLKENPARHVSIPEWDGSDIAKDTLLVYAEQGQGDSLQFIRYLPRLIGKASKIIFEAQPGLVKLFKDNPLYDGITIHPRDGTPPAADKKVALLSLPIRLGIEDDLFSSPMPYISPPNNGLRMRKPKGGALRVGLTWTGKPSHKNDRNRSLDLSQFAPLLDMAGVEFVSFQLGDSQKQIADQGLEPIIRDLSPHLDDFAATASFLQDVDLLISVDTSIVHLAGAMGVPTWALLAFTPDWRWQSRCAETRWYPSVTLYRQTSPDDWQELFHRVRKALKKKRAQIIT